MRESTDESRSICGFACGDALYLNEDCFGSCFTEGALDRPPLETVTQPESSIIKFACFWLLLAVRPVGGLQIYMLNHFSLNMPNEAKNSTRICDCPIWIADKIVGAQTRYTSNLTSVVRLAFSWFSLLVRSCFRALLYTVKVFLLTVMSLYSIVSRFLPLVCTSEHLMIRN